jgi:hypothetical protein
MRLTLKFAEIPSRGTAALTPTPTALDELLPPMTVA